MTTPSTRTLPIPHSHAQRWLLAHDIRDKKRLQKVWRYIRQEGVRLQYSVYLLAAAMKQAKAVDGPAIKAALEDLKAPVEGVVTTYNKPFTTKDHEAITANIPVFGEIKGEKVVYAYEADQKKASEIRVKDANAKGALDVKKK